MAKRQRRFGSLATELVKKAREAMLSAVQIYNNPQIEFKSELFIVTAIIAWTYLLHGYYRKIRVDYRLVDTRVTRKRRKFLRTKRGAFYHWSLEQCLEEQRCPLDAPVKKNLLFLIGIRHEIEHQMTTRIDAHLSAKFMATALNFTAAIKKHFGEKYSLEKEQAFSIQFSSIDQNTAKTLLAHKDLPQHISSFIAEFEHGMSDEEYSDPRFSYRVALVPRAGQKATTADEVYQLVPAGSAAADEINRVLLKETERTKYLPSDIVAKMNAEGYDKFTMHWHNKLWKEKDARNPKHQYGTRVAKAWYWYESWVDQVRKHCEQNKSKYRTDMSDQGNLGLSGSIGR